MLALSTVCGAQSNKTTQAGNAETPGGGAGRGRDDAHSKGPDVSGDDNKYVKHRKPPSVCDNTPFLSLPKFSSLVSPRAVSERTLLTV